MREIIITILWLVPIISMSISIGAGIILYISLYSYRKKKMLKPKNKGGST